MSLLPLIVARYIQQTYPAVLDPFLAQASISESTLNDPSIRRDLPDLRTLVNEYEAWILERSLREVTLSAQVETRGDARDLMTREISQEVRDTVLQSVRETYDQIGTGGFLSVRYERVAKRTFDTGSASYRATYPYRIIVTSTDKTLKTIDPETGEVDQLLEPHKAAILSFAVHPVENRYIITTSMDSTAILTDLITQQPLQTFQHAKFVVRCAFSADGRWLATASYDRTIVLYEDTQWGRPQHHDAEEEDGVDQGDDLRLARDPSLRYEARHRVVLQQNPESIVFDSRGRYLLYTTRGSHWLSYIHLPSAADADGEPFATSRKSFNVHPEDTHISFAVLNIVLDPTGRLVACQTGDHAGGTGERILIYDIDLPPPHPTPAPTTRDLPTRGNWLSSSPSESTPRENQRLSVIWTGQQGDDYILPRLAWLPDSSGIITTTTTGELVLHSLGGEQVKTLKVHGKADGRGRGGRPVGQQASEVVRDVCVVGERDDVGGWRVVSVGYDATVRIS